MKLIHLGRILPGAMSLADVVADGSTTVSLHVHIQDGQAGYRGDEAGGMDLSSYMIPLFLLLIAITWTAFLLWPNIFSLGSKLMLFFLSTAFITLVYATR